MASGCAASDEFAAARFNDEAGGADAVRKPFGELTRQVVAGLGDERFAFRHGFTSGLQRPGEIRQAHGGMPRQEIGELLDALAEPRFGTRG